VHHQLAQFAEAYDDVEGHPCTSKPTNPIVRAQQKNTANDCKKLSDLDQDPIRRARVTEVKHKADDPYGQIEAGDQNYRDRNPLMARSLADTLGSILIHQNPTALRFAYLGNATSLNAPVMMSARQECVEF
jgi:hypothetical protein